MAIDLDRKIGPLKLKTWGIVGAGTFGLVWYATRRGDLPTDAQDVPPIDDLGQNMPSADYFPATGGGGGFEGFDSAVDLAPVQDQLLDFTGQLEDIRAQLGTIAEQTASAPESEEIPIGGGPTGDPFGERLARLLARRRKLRAALKAADSGAERRRVQRRVRRTSRTIHRVRTRRRRASGRGR